MRNSDYKSLYVGLKEHFESRIISIEKDITKTASTLEKRLEGMNEFRETLKDQAAQFITRAELNAIRETIESDIRLLREYKATMDGKASQTSVNVSLLLALVGLIVGILGIFR